LWCDLKSAVCPTVTNGKQPERIGCAEACDRRWAWRIACELVRWCLRNGTRPRTVGDGPLKRSNVDFSTN
jgi:hypothetical protein